MKSNKGFTLIELLAVILILGIIALIAIPTVSSVVEQSRKGANENTGNQMVVSAEQYYKMCELRDGKDINGNECSSDLAHSSLNKDDMAKVLGIKGDIPNKEDLIVFRKDENNNISIIYKNDGFVCSNQVDISGNVVYKDTGIINNEGVKCISFIYREDGTIVSKNDNSEIIVDTGERTNGDKHYLIKMDDEDGNAAKIFYQSNDIRKNIYKVSFLKNKKIPNNAVMSWDLSEEQDESIMGWITYIEGSTENYELFIGSEGDIYANPDSSYSLSLLDNVLSMSFDNYHTDDVVNGTGMFGGNFNLTNLDISNLKFNNLTNMDSMFAYYGAYAPETYLDVSSINTSKVTNFSSLFVYAGYNSVNVTIVGLDKFDTSKVGTMLNLFGYFGFNSTGTIDLGDISNWNTSNVEDFSYTFTGLGSKAEQLIYGDINKWNTSNATSMIATFQGFCENMPNYYLDLSNWDTSKVTDMQAMFNSSGYASTAFSLLGIENWNTENVTDMSFMFTNTAYTATSLIIGDVGKWNIGNVTNLKYMFKNFGYNVSIFDFFDLSKWDTSNVTNMYGLFNSAGFNTVKFDIGDLDNWNTSKVTDMGYLFGLAGYGTTKINYWNIGDLSNWDTSNVENMEEMFNAIARYLQNVSVGDLSKWDTSNVTNMEGMFMAAGMNSKTIFIGDISAWNTSKVTNMTKMFFRFGKTATYHLDLSGWNVSKVKHSSYFNNEVTDKIDSPFST